MLPLFGILQSLLCAPKQVSACFLKGWINMDVLFNGATVPPACLLSRLLPEPFPQHLEDRWLNGGAQLVGQLQRILHRTAVLACHSLTDHQQHVLQTGDSPPDRHFCRAHKGSSQLAFLRSDSLYAQELASTASGIWQA